MGMRYVTVPKVKIPEYIRLPDGREIPTESIVGREYARRSYRRQQIKVDTKRKNK